MRGRRIGVLWATVGSGFDGMGLNSSDEDLITAGESQAVNDMCRFTFMQVPDGIHVQAGGR